MDKNTLRVILVLIPTLFLLLAGHDIGNPYSVLLAIGTTIILILVNIFYDL